MKSLFITLVLYAISLPIIPSTTKADLVGVLPTTPGGNNYQAYYDTVENLTWLANGNANSHMDWITAKAWAEGLSINGVTGWRLPNTFQPDASCDSQGNEGGYGYNCTGSELGHFFFCGSCDPHRWMHRVIGSPPMQPALPLGFAPLQHNQFQFLALHFGQEA
jgi:hypothetical protein